MEKFLSGFIFEDFFYIFKNIFRIIFEREISECLAAAGLWIYFMKLAWTSYFCKLNPLKLLSIWCVFVY